MRKIAFYISIILFSILFFVPLITAFYNANLNDIKEILINTYYLRIIKFTFKQAITSTLLSLIIGLPGAWIVSQYDFKLKKTVKAIYYIPYVLPSILVVLGFVIFYGNSGLLNKIFNSNIKILYSYKAVLIAHVFFNFPVVINLVSNKWASLSKELNEEAKSSGANEFVIFQRITLPQLINSIISACVIVFLFCFSSFAIILVLGGGPKLTTIEVEIYKLSRISFNLGKASSLALVSLFTAIFTLVFYNMLSSKQIIEESSGSPVKPLKSEICYKRLMIYGYLAITLLFLLLPIIGIIIRSFESSSFKNINFQAIINTLLIGLTSAFVTLFLSISICSILKTKKNKILETILMCPMATSSIILGLGYYICSKQLHILPDFVLIVLCHGVLNVPYAIKSILPVYSGLPLEQVEAAKIDGCTDFNILLSIEFPFIKKTLISTYMFIFALSCGELNSTLMISNSNFLTIPVQIQRLIASYNFKGACAMGSVLILISAVVFVLSQTVDF